LSEKKDLKGALVCAKELLARYLRVFDKSSPHLTWIYYHLATLHSANEEQKEAVGYAQQRLAIISKVIHHLHSFARLPNQPRLKRPRSSLT
jgi:hypothetical protein